MTTYKTDFSFFGYLNTPGSFLFIHEALTKWFDEEPNAQFRLIVDLEAEDDCATFSELQDLYPGVKTVAVINNPWRKLVVIYRTIKKAVEEEDRVIDSINGFDVSNFTFESFLSQLDTPIGKWYSILTPQSKWIENANELLYVIRDDFVEEDFKSIQQYFETDKPFEVDLFDYKIYYTEETQKLVEEQFKEDIERFNFTF